MKATRDLDDVADPATRMTALAAASPGLSVVVRGRRHAVSSLAEASRKFCAARDAAGSGMSDTPVVFVERGGESFAYLSYNGRVWAGKPKDWTAGQEPLYDPRAARGRE